MKIVIDTNVLVSAAVANRNPEAIILFVTSQIDYQWLVSEEILREYKEVLSRKRLKLNEDKKQRWFFVLDTFTTWVDIRLVIDFPRDRKDAKFLACAVETQADYLITGDKDFDEIKSLGNTKIISVSLFKNLVIDRNE
ncbi:putative toxin-antitoxin system toxin component, PIN family [Aphanothece hegewaldii CCALA 016]|uniref:Putative toxin-antitoxin system toxin component, PIN family n=1 Tax=Aphanothece hegewaldii CCALA 016 TaxID=2107694 RepID=A0A2T1LSL8_9CHRO|nr:putative toxin-antitoxin system toxin component, PIN family [Aphanothece hegewaldii]PSF33049.1 putative toxin-antitoxin system toxin component, PIN family [Aphanothece hegewaldii CCALA 016]